MLDSLGRVVGVDSNGDRATNSAYDAVGAHVEWFALQSSSRIADYADGISPTDSPCWESYGETVLWNGWMDAEDVHLVGDFTGFGHDQLMLINRGGVAGRVMIISFAPGFAWISYFESYGDNPSLNGWRHTEDGFVVGDFMGSATIR